MSYNFDLATKEFAEHIYPEDKIRQDAFTKGAYFASGELGTSAQLADLAIAKIRGEIENLIEHAEGNVGLTADTAERILKILNETQWSGYRR